MAQHSHLPLSRPQRHLFRMLVFLILSGFIIFILHKQIIKAFMSNPSLNGLIIFVLIIGIMLALRQVLRLFPEVRWINALAQSSPETPLVSAAPALLAPMALVLNNRMHDQPLSVSMTRSMLDSVGARLDEGREIIRYMTGLLIFLGLLGTFWGLIETVGSVGTIISSLTTGDDAAVLFQNLKEGLAEPLKGMGLSFSASLFGLASSLILGFLDLQAGQAQNMFYNELEDWLSSATTDAEQQNAVIAEKLHILATTLERMLPSLPSGEKSREDAEQIRNLVQSLHSEHLLIRGWMEAQNERDKDLRTLIQMLVRQEKP